MNRVILSRSLLFCQRKLSSSATDKTPKAPKEGKKKASSPSPAAAASPSTNPSPGTPSQRPSNPSSSSGSSLPKIEPNQPAGNEYKVPEYFQHDKDTYAELMAQMQKQRLPPPVKP